MTLPMFIAFFVLLLGCSSFFILGFYVITRGREIEMPNGEIRAVGKIFKGWSLFWEQTVGTKKIYFIGNHLLEQYENISRAPEVGSKLTVSPDEKNLILVEPLSKDELRVIKEITGYNILVESPNSLHIYQEEPEYYFPEFIRFPLSQCPPCMASVGGIIIYWVIILLQPNIFAWTPHKVLAYIFFWVFFTVSLSATNYLLS